MADAQRALQDALRRLSQGPGILDDNLRQKLTPALREHWAVTDQDSPMSVYAKVHWHLDQLIAQLNSDEIKAIARYSFNMTDDPAVQAEALVERQNKLAESGGPSRRTSGDAMTNTILPAFASFMLNEPPTAVPAEVTEAVGAGNEATPKRTVALPRSKRPVRLIAAMALVALIAIGGVVTLLLIRDGGNGAQAGPSATAGNPTIGLPAGPTRTEVGGNRNGSPTFKDPFNPSETGPKVPFRQEVQVSCKVKAFSIDSIGPEGYWYRIASPPWNNEYYSPAITFLNGDPVEGPYTHNVDREVPTC